MLYAVDGCVLTRRWWRLCAQDFFDSVCAMAQLEFERCKLKAGYAVAGDAGKVEGDSTDPAAAAAAQQAAQQAAMAASLSKLDAAKVRAKCLCSRQCKGTVLFWGTLSLRCSPPPGPGPTGQRPRRGFFMHRPASSEGRRRLAHAATLATLGTAPHACV